MDLRYQLPCSFIIPTLITYISLELNLSCVSLDLARTNGDCAIIARWLDRCLTNGFYVFAYFVDAFADLAVTRDGARGRWLGHFVALSGQARSVPVQVAASIIGGCSHHDAHERRDKRH